MAAQVREDGTRAMRFDDARGQFVLVGLLLAATFVGLLWVPSYAHVTPTVGGIPFFYWYSVLWLLLNAVSQVIAYQVVARRVAVRRAGPDGGGSGMSPDGAVLK